LNAAEEGHTSMSCATREGGSPDVSVIIPMYNAEKTIAYALRSVLEQEGVSFEVVVVDDGSSDGSVNVVRSMHDPRVTVVSQPSLSQPATCNTGLRQSRGRFIAFQDSDDIWHQGKLRRQLDLLESHPEVDVVFCNALNENPTVGTRALVFDQFRDLIASIPKERLAPSTFGVRGNIRYFLLQGNFIISRATTLIRRSVFQRFGYFDEHLRGTDDLDLWLRIGDNASFAAIEEPLFTRIKQETSLTNSKVSWLVEIVKLWEKWNSIEAVRLDEDERRMALTNLRRSYRSLIKAEAKAWSLLRALESFRKSTHLGLDVVALAYALAGVGGPFFFKIGSLLKRSLWRKYPRGF